MPPTTAAALLRRDDVRGAVTSSQVGWSSDFANSFSR
jgi:hypothetical protein